MKSNILVVGSANADLVFRSERLPKPGETLMGQSFAVHPGGKGANQAVAIGKLGGMVGFVGCLGHDAFGEQLLGSLKSGGVLTDAVQIHPTVATGSACILVDDLGANMIVVGPGSNGELSASHVREVLAIQQPAAVLCQLEIPMEAVKAAAEADFFVLNPAPARELSDELLAKCAFITPNETECQALTGIEIKHDEDCQRAGELLLAKGVKNVVITLGDRGCYWISADHAEHFPACAVNAIDTTAAGDAFNGALVLAITEGHSTSDAIRFAIRVASLSTTKVGAQESMPSRADLDLFL